MEMNKVEVLFKFLQGTKSKDAKKRKNCGDGPYSQIKIHGSVFLSL